MGTGAIHPQELELAVSGLSGMVGAMLLPTLSAWVRLFMRWLESPHSTLGGRRRLPGGRLLTAFGYTVVLGLLIASLLRAAGELWEIRVEAPVVGLSVQSMTVGAMLWVLYAVAFGILRRDVGRDRRRRQYPSLR